MINRAKQNKINTWKRFFEKSTYFIAINFWYEWIWSDITVLRTVFHFVWDWILKLYWNWTRRYIHIYDVDKNCEKVKVWPFHVFKIGDIEKYFFGKIGKYSF